MRDDVPSQIQELLSKLYFLTAKEIKEIRASLQELPSAGLREILQILREAEGRQQAYLGKLVEKNSQFAEEFKLFFQGNLRILLGQKNLFENKNHS